MIFPWWNTMTRGARVKITSMRCSTINRVTPMVWMARTSAIACWISEGVSPASASSRRSRRGSVASARAISNRLRPGVPRVPARWWARAAKPVNSRTRIVAARAAARRGWRRKAPAMALSRMVISSNVAGTWWVRARPSRACASGNARVTSAPLNTTEPPVGGSSPARQLKKVDFPAPFGPMMPTISPSFTRRSAWATAVKPSKDLVTLCALSRMAVPDPLRPEHPRGQGSPPQLQQAPRLEPAQQEDDRPIEDVRQARAPAAEQRVGLRLQRHQDGRAQQRAGQGPGAAQGRDDHHLDGDEDAEPAVGVDEPDH